jgi:hypothetical protein
VGGEFLWKNIRKISNPCKNPFWLYLGGAMAHELKDEEDSWTNVDRFDVTGCEYKTISELTEDQASWRLRELDRQYALPTRHHSGGAKRLAGQSALNARTAMLRFTPQPYIQLAAAFRDAGYEQAAAKILVRLERNKTRYGDFGIFRKCWRWLLDAFLRYGYSPFRPLLIVLVWAMVSAVWFQIAHDRKQLVAVDKPSALPQSEAQPRPSFSALVYAVDTLIPIVDLNQKKNWTIKTLSTVEDAGPARGVLGAVCNVVRTVPNSVAANLLIFNTFFGWLMTTLFAAGVGGLLRTSK